MRLLQTFIRSFSTARARSAAAKLNSDDAIPGNGFLETVPNVFAVD
jgi:hypothetical protein